jgi:ABC-type uncharacterized transport system substrate-binding protein
MHRMRRLASVIAALVTVASSIALTAAQPSLGQGKPAKRAYIVMSQEPGHPCGEPQAEGVLEALAAAGWTQGRNLTVRRHYMDQYITNVTPEALRETGQKALADIAAFKPDILFIMDDASIQFVMMPLIGQTDIPIVFSGMNAQPEFYNAQKKIMESRARPGGNVTGMYEQLYAAQSLKVMMEAIPGLRGGKAVMITDTTGTGNALTKQFELELKDVKDVTWEVKRAKDWSEYTALIEALNSDPSVKAIYPIAMTLAGPDGTRYSASQIYDWTIPNSRKPEMAVNYFFARMGLFGGAVVNFGSMGRYAGQKSARILDGAKAGDISIDDAPDYAIVFNVKRARDLGIEIPARVLAAAHAVYKDDLVPLRGKQLVYDPQTKSF